MTKCKAKHHDEFTTVRAYAHDDKYGTIQIHICGCKSVYRKPRMIKEKKK